MRFAGLTRWCRFRVRAMGCAVVPGVGGDRGPIVQDPQFLDTEPWARGSGGLVENGAALGSLAAWR